MNFILTKLKVYIFIAFFVGSVTLNSMQETPKEVAQKLDAWVAETSSMGLGHSTQDELTLQKTIETAFPNSLRNQIKTLEEFNALAPSSLKRSKLTTTLLHTKALNLRDQLPNQFNRSTNPEDKAAIIKEFDMLNSRFASKATYKPLTAEMEIFKSTL